MMGEGVSGGKKLSDYLFYHEPGPPSITIYKGDCVEVMKLLPKVDIVITDPPYGEETHSGARTGESGDELLVTFDSQTAEQTEQQFEQFVEIANRWVIATIEWRHMLALSKRDWFIRFGVWVKPNWMPQYTGDRPGTGWEAVAICHRPGKKVWNGGGRLAVWNYPKVHGFHPTGKPLPLIKSWLVDFSNEGDTILDPFGGSGTTAVACKDLKRNCIMVEKEEAYCQIAVNRLKNTIVPMF